jgi:trehalose 6-phosphate synthase
VIRYRQCETRLVVQPNTIDSTAFTRSRDDSEIAGLRDQLAPRRVLLGVDRLDYAKGIPERLLAFERLLERYPQWQRKVTLLQICLPSRLDISDYAELRHRVESLVGRINGRFGETDWVPVCYLARSYSREALAQLYRLADVALVTPLRDGMNLVAKEFVAAQDPERPGVLVLSKFAGAAEQMIAALLTNPFHCEGLAADIDCALQMPLDERRHRMGSLRRVLDENGTPSAWAHTLLGQLRATHSARWNRSTT